MSWVYVILVETGSLVEILHYEPFLCYWWKFPSNFDNFYIIIVLDKCYPNIGKFSVIETSVIKAMFKDIFKINPLFWSHFHANLVNIFMKRNKWTKKPSKPLYYRRNQRTINYQRNQRTINYQRTINNHNYQKNQRTTNNHNYQRN